MGLANYVGDNLSHRRHLVLFQSVIIFLIESQVVGSKSFPHVKQVKCKSKVSSSFSAGRQASNRVNKK